MHQPDPLRLPFEDNSVDWVTAVCIFHHINPQEHATLVAETCRVLRPGGIFAMIEHNPLNPAVQLIVRQTPVDENARLLTAGTVRRLMQAASMQVGRNSSISCACRSEYMGGLLRWSVRLAACR